MKRPRVLRRIALVVTDVATRISSSVRLNDYCADPGKHDGVKSGGRHVEACGGGRVINSLTTISLDFRETRGELRSHDGRFLDLESGKCSIRHWQRHHHPDASGGFGELQRSLTQQLLLRGLIKAQLTIDFGNYSGRGLTSLWTYFVDFVPERVFR